MAQITWPLISTSLSSNRIAAATNTANETVSKTYAAVWKGNGAVVRSFARQTIDPIQNE